MSMNTQQNTFSIWSSLCLAIGPVAAASTIGSLATLPNIPDWYQFLVKPWFTPPNWIFGPVWTTLYTIIAYAFYRILRKPGPGSKFTSILAFMVQITLNAGWSVGFFGGRSPLVGMVLIVPLLAAVAWTMLLFWRQDRISGLCFVPYLAWVSFAAALNLGIFLLNS